MLSGRKGTCGEKGTVRPNIQDRRAWPNKFGHGARRSICPSAFALQPLAAECFLPTTFGDALPELVAAPKLNLLFVQAFNSPNSGQIPGTPYIIPGAQIELRMVSPELRAARLRPPARLHSRRRLDPHRHHLPQPAEGRYAAAGLGPRRRQRPQPQRKILPGRLPPRHQGQRQTLGGVGEDQAVTTNIRFTAGRVETPFAIYRNATNYVWCPGNSDQNPSYSRRTSPPG